MFCSHSIPYLPQLPPEPPRVTVFGFFYAFSEFLKFCMYKKKEIYIFSIYTKGSMLFILFCTLVFSFKGTLPYQYRELSHSFFIGA